MVANALKTWVKQSSPWEEWWFVKCNEKLCKLLSRFLQLNNNIKPSLFESLGFLRCRTFYGKYFVFHMNLAIQEARTILDQSIISIEKTSSSNTERELIGVCTFWCSCHQCDEHSLNALIGNLKYLKNFDRGWSSSAFFYSLVLHCI